MVDEGKLNQFIGQMLGDLGGAVSVALVRMGDALGLYQTLHAKGAMTCARARRRRRVDERYLREWLSHQAASNYLSYEPASGRFALPPEQAMVFAIEDSPVYMMGAFDSMAAQLENQAKVQQAFKAGGGVAWGDQAGCLFCATARFFQPGLPEQSRAALAAGARRRGGEARARRQGRRCRLRLWLVDRADGAGVPEVAVRRLRLPSRARSSRRAAHAEEHGVGGQHALRGGHGQGVPGQRLRPRDLLRLPARHGRPDRVRRARPPGAEAGWHLDDRRADGQATGWRTTSIRSAGCSTPPRP